MSTRVPSCLEDNILLWFSSTSELLAFTIIPSPFLRWPLGTDGEGSDIVVPFVAEQTTGIYSLYFDQL